MTVSSQIAAFLNSAGPSSPADIARGAGLDTMQVRARLADSGHFERNDGTYSVASQPSAPVGYSLTEAEYDAMLARQEGRCAMCGEYRRLQVDHDHATGEVRALLCRFCNVVVGWVESHPDRVDAAKAYLAR